MPLQSWYSNNAQFDEMLHEDIPCNSPTTFSTSEINVLGIIWNVANDSLSVKPSKLIQKYVEQCVELQSQQNCLSNFKIVSKRKVISLIASVFDPLGLISPLLIGPKIFIQKLWSLKLDWDSSLQPELCAEFLDLCKNLLDISSLQFPRFVIVPHKCDLHIFADASKKAYGFAAYAVQLDSQISFLLTSKSRVAPNKDLSIPKLELTALNLASKFASTLMQSNKLSFTSCTLWSDSKVAIAWVNNHRSMDVYVRNRVDEIRRNNFPVHYVPTQDNPADMLTRKMLFKQFSNSYLWQFGPNWLIAPSEYPSQADLNTDIVVNELLAEPVVAEPFVPCLDVSKYSSLCKVVRIFQIVLKFILCFRRKPDISLSPLHLLVKLAQQEQYPTVFHYLKTVNCIGVSSNIISFVNHWGYMLMLKV